MVHKRSKRKDSRVNDGDGDNEKGRQQQGENKSTSIENIKINNRFKRD